MSSMKRSYEKLLTPAGNYIAGTFSKPKDQAGVITIKSPADFSDVLGAFTYCYQDVDTAVASARDAFEGWRNSAQSTRTEYLVKYRDALKKNRTSPGGGHCA